MVPGRLTLLALEQTDLTAFNAIATLYVAQLLATCSDAQLDWSILKMPQAESCWHARMHLMPVG